MKEQPTITCSHETLADHIDKYFFQSLVSYSEKYPLNHLAYICPLCLENRILIDKESVHVTETFDLDHFPPQSVGGKNKILTCKKCNGKAGINFDYILKKKLNELAYSQQVPNSKIPMTTHPSNIVGEFKGLLGYDENGKGYFSYVPKDNKNVYLKKYRESIESSTTPIDLTVQFMNKDDNDKVEKAILKAAYLYCFSTWGYDFAFSKNGEMIRGVINGEREYPINVLDFLTNNQNLNEGIHRIGGNDILSKAEIVNIPLLDKECEYKTFVSVILPPPNENGWVELTNINSYLENLKEERLNILLYKEDSIFK